MGDIEDDDGTNKTCKEKIAPYITISPKSSYKIAWDILIGFVYLTCYIIDPLVYSFHFDILVHYPDLNRFQRSLTWLIVIDMCVECLTAVRKKDMEIKR